MELAKNRVESCETVINYFARIEFQDGKRKRGNPNARMPYHGSGRPHVHFLVWLQNVEAIQLPGVVCASLPEDNSPLKSIVVCCELPISRQ